MVGKHHSRKIISRSIQYVYHKSDTIATVLETSPPSVTFRRDLLGPRLTRSIREVGHGLVNARA